jgi:uncharacterized membrane protein YecN with MAPEG domain
MTTAVICAAVLAAMLFLLGFNVSRLRGERARTGGPQLPTDPADRLFIAIRAHGNASEYIPTLIILFLLVGARGPAVVAIPLIVGGTVSRIAHAIGMLRASSLAAESGPRMAGALGTYAFGTALAVAAAFTL